MDTLDTLTPAIPQATIDSLTTIFAVSALFSMLLFAIITTFYVIGAIRKWKMESAVFAIRKDLAEIKHAIVVNSEGPSGHPQLEHHDPAASPERTL